MCLQCDSSCAGEQNTGGGEGDVMAEIDGQKQALMTEEGEKAVPKSSKVANSPHLNHDKWVSDQGMSFWSLRS